MAGPISTTPSAGCRRSRRRARTCSTPGLRDLATIRTVAASVARPLNVVMSAADPAVTADQLAEAGVKRISVGGALSRLALAHMMKGAREMKERGGFTWIAETLSSQELRKLFS